MDNAYLIAGLGNPGQDYAKTRHNAGFMVAEALALRWKASWRMESAFSAKVASARRGGARISLCQPQTYMNLSGDAVGALTAYYRIPHNRILVLVDDADLPLGTLRMRTEGSSGGHHGLESIESSLGTRQYSRLKLGIGRLSTGERQIRNYVLGRFQPDEWLLWEKVVDRAASQVECWLDDGPEKAMNRFNGTVDNPGTKDS
jgi:peptidyl-tRNA hydrolase, PTH1 family